MLDTDFIRSLYDHYQGEYADWALFENAGGSAIPRPVLNGFTDFLAHYKVQPYAPYGPSIRAGEAMDRGYAVIAELLGAGVDEITIGPSTTANTYVLAQALRPTLRAGDEIIVTNQDHEANIGAWRRLEADGAVVLEWGIDPVSGELALDDLARLLSPRTRVVCFTLCSNIVGSFNDVAAITGLVRDAGALSVGDGVSFAPHRLPDPHACGLDVFCFSTYKTFAPHAGVLWCHPDSQDVFAPQGHGFNASAPHYRMNPAGPQHAEIAALGYLAEYFAALHDHHVGGEASLRGQALAMYERFAAHENALAERLLGYLRGRDDVRIVGRPSADGGRAATISFTLAGRTSRSVVEFLATRRIGASSGHFYALRCIEALGIDAADGVVRISMVHYNTMAEVDRLVEALDALSPGPAGG